MDNLFDMTVQTDEGPMSTDQIFDTLYFSSYCANRDLGMSPERYARLIPVDIAQFEKRYQAIRGKHSQQGGDK